MKPWHTLHSEEVLQQLGVDPSKGLDPIEATRRLREFGSNELQASREVSPWAILLEQFQNILILILVVAIALSAFLGHAIEATAIAVIVVFAVVLGFVQEYRAERAIEALRRMAAPTASVLRAGKELNIPAREIVPGDIILIHAGDKIPADARLIEAVNLQIEEAALTGESVAVQKLTLALSDAELPVGDRKNMAFAGTIATYGRGLAVVIATGMRTVCNEWSGETHSFGVSRQWRLSAACRSSAPTRQGHLQKTR